MGHFGKNQARVPIVLRTEIEPTHDDDPMYFPPPPTYAASTATKPMRMSKPPTPPKPVAPDPSERLSRRSSSHRQYIGFQSQPRRKRLREVHLSKIKLSTRQWILVTLLFLAFLVLVFGFIFADCVALPHTDRTDGYTGDQVDLDNVALFGRRQAGEFLDPIVKPTAVPNLGSDSSSISQGVSVGLDSLNGTGLGGLAGIGGSINPPNGTSPSDALANESKRLGFDSPKNLAILFLYTATLPLVTMFHTIAELIVLWCAKKPSSTSGIEENDSDSDKDSITKMKTLSLAKKHRVSSRSNPGRLNAILGFLPAMSLTASVLVICGWIVSNIIQMHCEIPIPPVGGASITDSTQAICPIQIRGHFMHGIHELSIVKSVFSWILVTVYIGYAVWCIRINGLVWRTAKEQRKARKSRIDLEGKREKQLKRNIVRFAAKRETEPVRPIGRVHQVDAMVV